MTLGDVIHQYRETHGCSMDAFAAASGLSKAYISMLEKNKNPKTQQAITPSVVTFKCAADAMGISLDELLGMVDENQPVFVVANPEPRSGIRLWNKGIKFKSDKKVRLSCKIDSTLYDDLACAADANDRTVEDEIEERLFWSIQNEIDDELDRKSNADDQ